MTRVPAGASRAAAARRITGNGQRSPRASTSIGFTGRRRPELGPHGRDSAGQLGNEPADVRIQRRGDRVQRQRDSNIPVGEHPHRGQDMTWLERARGAGRAGTDGKAPTVELDHQRLAIDIEQGERQNVREPVVRVTDDIHVRQVARRRAQSPDEGRRQGALVRAGRLGLSPGLSRGQRDRDHRLDVGATVLDLTVRAGTAPARALRDDQHSQTAGATP